MNKDSKQNLENKKLSIFIGLSLTCIISGGYALLDAHNISQQINILLHIIVGFAFSISFIIYLIPHFQRTTGTRKPIVIISGALASLIIIVYLSSGWILAIEGNKETSRSISYWHTTGAILFVTLPLIHVLLHRFIKYNNKKTTIKTYDFKTLKDSAIFCIIYTVIVLILSIAYWVFDKPLPLKDLTKNYQYTYGDHPFRPSQTETSHGGFVHTKQVADSHKCASCHEDIAEQWYSSIHRQAASDPTYVRNVTLLASKKDITATRYCEGCHAPEALLTGELTSGGKHGGIAGTPANHEGISCLSCHAISDTAHLNGVASYIFTPAEEYLFAYSDNSALFGISQYLTKVSSDQHRKDMGRPILQDTRHCSTCHTQFMDKEMNDWGWVKMQDEYSAWLNSPYSQQHQQAFSASKVTRCQDCHMPLIEASDPSADSNGMIRSHRFLGANTMAPFLSGDIEQLAMTQEFLQSNKMRITIEKPHRSNATQSTLNLNEQLRQHTETPYYYYLGETIDLKIVVSNVGVGHDFPGGTADINEPWIELKITDSNGKKVFHSGFLEQDGSLDKQAHAYISKPIDRHGNEVWRHDLFNMVGSTFKNVIKSGQSDVASYSIKVPSDIKGPLIATAKLRYRKLNNRYARWALQDQYRDLPITDMARDTLTIPIFLEKDVMQ